MSLQLRESYPGLVCDLDGVVYRGADPVPYAVEQLSKVIDDSPGGIVYATNNASRPPQEVAEHLQELGLSVSADQVINSSMAGADVLADRLDPGSAVLAVGGVGVGAALVQAGLQAVAPEQMSQRAEPVRAVLQGYGSAVSARDLAEIAYAVASGASWIVTNDDRTLPTDRGIAPGNGSLVAAVQMAVDEKPEVVGKPGPLMYQLAAQRLGTDAQQTLAIGDRLETDIAGAHAARMDALLVLTGVHGVTDVVACDADLRPRFIARDLRCLDEPYDEPVHGDSGWRVGELTGRLDVSGEQPTVRFDATQSTTTDEHASLRIALRVLWTALDEDRLTTRAAVSAIQPWQ